MSTILPMIHNDQEQSFYLDTKSIDQNALNINFVVDACNGVMTITRVVSNQV